MQAFNLLDEPWITVCFPDGSRGGVGIREALLEAKKIRAIENTSPLVVVAIHRLLLAVLYRALSEEMPLSGEREDQILASGFPGNSLNGYFGKWSRRFYLFDDEFPFWQMPRLAGLFKDKDYFSWTVLAAEHNTKNTKVLFDHFDVNSGEPIPYAAAARWLAAAQTFSLSCKTKIINADNSPSASLRMVMIAGRNLLETLVFNLVGQSREISREDRAVWEREPESYEKLKAKFSRPADGFADLYTWPSRAILLKHSESGVAKVAFASGVVCAANSRVSDPMAIYIKNPDTGEFHGKKLSNNGTWRDFNSLLPNGSDSVAPQTMNHAAKIIAHADGPTHPGDILIFGQANDNAKILYWRSERFSLPRSACLDNSNFKNELTSLLSKAKDYSEKLEEVCIKYVGEILPKKKGKIDKVKAKRKVQALPIMKRYWTSLEEDFHQLLREMAAGGNLPDLITGWHRHIRLALISAWKPFFSSEQIGNGRSFHALVKADLQFGGIMKQINGELGEETEVSEDASDD